MDATLRLARDGESYRLGDDAVTHECAHTHGTVIGASYFVSDAGVDAPYLELGRKHDVRLELRGLAEKRQQTITFAAGSRHLVQRPRSRASTTNAPTTYAAQRWRGWAASSVQAAG